MKGILRRHSFSIAFVIVLFVFLFNMPGDDDEVLQLSGYTMGTTFHFQFVDLPPNFNQVQIQQDITALLQRLDRQVFSTYAEDSELSRFNKAPVGATVRSSSELIEVTVLALEISEMTAGAFDVTVAPLVNLWGFGPTVNETLIPTEARLNAARQNVGYQHLKVNVADSWISKDAQVSMDMSAIAKGYAVDQVARYFDSIGIANYFLEIGGELKIRGSKAAGQNWVPAVERPVDGAPQVYEILNSLGEELAIAGSGDYRNYFEENGVRYSHEIDPRTGKPVRNNLAAVYVIDLSTARADALATAFMVLGYEQGIDLARDQGLAVYFIVREETGAFSAYYTDQFARYIDSEG